MSGASTRGPDDPPEGWRWESYKNVQLAVPGDWGYGATGRPWCLRRDDGPAVGRPGYLRSQGCRVNTTKKETEVSTGGQFVWFEPAKETTNQVTRVSLTGDRSIVRAGNVKVSVQTTAKVRHQILDSIHLIDTDHNGCPAVPPFAGRPDWRPKGLKITKLKDAKEISACRYEDAELRSSIRLTGKEATEALTAMRQTRILGYGPSPLAAECVPDKIPRADQILLKLDQGTIALRYAGCLLPGLDDGTDVHILSRKAVQPFLAEPNRVNSWTKPHLTEILRPPLMRDYRDR